MPETTSSLTQIVAPAVYILSMLTCTACAILLLRGYKRSGAALLLWSGLCFAGLTINNLLLFIDLVILPTSIDLTYYRQASTLISLLVLLYGLIWESE